VYQWSRDALEEFLHIRDAHPEAGVWLASGYDLCQQDEQEKPRWLDLIRHRELKSHEIPTGISNHQSSLPIRLQMRSVLFLTNCS
jgi:hypothetical protein